MSAHIEVASASVDVFDGSDGDGDDEAVRLVVSGRCDAGTADRLVRLADAIRDDRLVLDLTGLTAGGDALLAAIRRLGDGVEVRTAATQE